MPNWLANIVFAFLVPIVCCACQTSGIDGNGRRATEDRHLEGFSMVDNRSVFDVAIDQGDVFSVTASVDSNLLSLLDTHVEGQTLVIDSHEQIGDVLPGPHVTVRMPRVASTILSGSGVVVLSSNQSDPLSLTLSGSGVLDFRGTAPRLDARLDGSGNVRLSGSTDHIVLNLGGSGDIDATEFPASSGSVDLDGSGDVRATINGPVDVSLSGAGNVDLYGGAVIGRSSITGSGNIRTH